MGRISLPSAVMVALSAFLQNTYTGYNEKERAHASFLRKADLIGVPACGMVYLVVASHVEAPGGPAPQSAPLWVEVCRALFVGLANLVLYQHCCVAPYPLEETPEMFKVTTKVGRWIFLTRQTLCLQALHSVFSIIPSLQAGSHAMSVLIGGLGIFVTCQYFALVAPHPDFKASSATWGSRGVPYKELMHFLHVPCGVLACLDIMVLKQRSLLLAQTAPFTQLMGVYLVYVVLYVALLHGNHSLMGEWPYGMMKDLGASYPKWAKFVVIQFAVLVLFVTIALAASRYAPVFW